MRNVLMFICGITAAMVLTPVGAQTPPMTDLRPLFDAIQKAGTESELRGDIADRLGFGEHPLTIKDLVVTKDGVQHALNAFVAGGKPYILFDSHLRVPEVYIFVIGVDGALAAGIHGPQGTPITDTVDMTRNDAEVVGAEQAFWSQWLAAGAKPPS